MRRKEREITDKAALEAVIQGAFYTTLAMPEADAPYLVPLNFGYEDGVVYLHCARAGKKLDLLRAANGPLPVSLLFVAKAALLDKGTDSACGFSTRYASVAATGMLEETADDEERLKGLRALSRQAGAPDRPFSAGDMKAVVVLRVVISGMTGKVNDPA